MISSLGSGGAERNMVVLAEALAQRDYEVTLLTLRSDVSDFFAAPAQVKRVYASPAVARSHRWFNIPGQWQRNQALRCDLLNTAPDAIISFINTTNIAVLQAIANRSIPIIVSERTAPQVHPVGWRWHLLRRLYYPLATSVVLQTEAARHWALKQWPRWQTAVIPNPAFPPQGLAPCERPTFFHPTKRNIIAVGRLATEKQFDLLLRAFAKIATQFPDWQLAILGEGELRSALEAQIVQLKLADRVSLPGQVSNLNSILHDADLFVLSSRYEGFPNVLLEAMACGLPAISVDCPSGPRAIIRHEIDGLLVPQNDAQALSEAMAELMASQSKRQQLAANAPDVVHRFSLERTLEQWEDLIATALNLKP